MTYITYTPIDRQFKTLEKDLPPGAQFNGIDPVSGITFGFALQSKYPLAPNQPDIRFGTVSDSVQDNPSILLKVLTKDEYDNAYTQEMKDREPPEPQPYTIPTFLIRQRAEKIGIWDDLSAYLVQYPALMLKTLTLQTGVDPKDPDLIKGLTDLGVPQSVQDYLLSDPSLGV